MVLICRQQKDLNVQHSQIDDQMNAQKRAILDADAVIIIKIRKEYYGSKVFTNPINLTRLKNENDRRTEMDIDKKWRSQEYL